jgi:hypothetical protein
MMNATGSAPLRVSNFGSTPLVVLIKSTLFDLGRRPRHSSAGVEISCSKPPLLFHIGILTHAIVGCRCFLPGLSSLPLLASFSPISARKFFEHTNRKFAWCDPVKLGGEAASLYAA